jgi:hypothetical protein
MKQSFALALVLCTVTAGTGHAKCIREPNIRAEVRVYACVAVTFKSSNTKIEMGIQEPMPWYKPESTYTGTLLSVEVKKARFLWQPGDDRKRDDLHLWRRGEAISVFVDKSAADACPAILPKTLTLETVHICCDVLPYHDQCLIPGSLVRVVIPKE